MEQPHADLDRVTALVPVRVLEHAKTRLGSVLDAEERAARR
jgi:2-phospho-L-lactate guanylyltransferase (CobY/MobA/RfbA family)